MVNNHWNMAFMTFHIYIYIYVYIYIYGSVSKPKVPL